MPEKNQHFSNQKMPEEDAITIDLLELFMEILHHWVIIILCTLLFGAAVFAYCKFLVTPVYESTSELYVLSTSNDENSSTSLSDLQIGSNLSDDYVVVMSGRPVLEQVQQNLHLDMTYDEINAKVSIDTLSDRIITITAEDTDPEMAAKIADETAKVASAYISEKMAQEPPSIIESGYTEEDPVFPKTKRMTLLGAILGFLLSAGIVILRYITDDTIMTAEDVEKKLGVNVLGTLPLVSAELDSNEDDPRNKKKNKNKKSKVVKKQK